MSRKFLHFDFWDMWRSIYKTTYFFYFNCTYSCQDCSANEKEEKDTIEVFEKDTKIQDSL